MGRSFYKLLNNGTGDMAWTEKELAFLYENHDTLSYKEIGNVLNKTPSCIGTMCHTLGLQKKQRTVWSEQDIQYLLDNYKTQTCAVIAQYLNKTTRAVQHKFAEFGLCRESSKPTSVTIGQQFRHLTISDLPYSIRVGKAQKLKWKVKCRCQCGKTIDAWLNSLLDGRQKSCGCLNSATNSVLCRYRNKKYTKEITSHALYRQWQRIRHDCIREWSNYETFYDWAISIYKDKHTAIKIDVSLPYSSDNTKFDRIGKKSSIQEKEIKDYLSVCGYTFKKNRTVLDGQEIDLYNEQLKLGIEYCGLYWHSEQTGKFRSYHYDKYQALSSQDIRLITIFGDEWDERREQVHNFLSAIIGHHDRRVFARKCRVCAIESKQAKEFIEQNHIQGAKTALFYVGLYSEDELVGCMSLAKHHRGEDCLVLDRMCFKSGWSVVGGASKMLNACVVWAKNNNYSRIISWSDNRWSQGHVYEKMGFVLDGELGPDYSYIKLSDGRKRISKQSMMKSKTGCPKDMTEKEWAIQNGYSRIWDCGKKRWLFTC